MFGYINTGLVLPDLVLQMMGAKKFHRAQKSSHAPALTRDYLNGGPVVSESCNFYYVLNFCFF